MSSSGGGGGGGRGGVCAQLTALMPGSSLHLPLRVSGEHLGLCSTEGLLEVLKQ